jgi:hypothetical protein
MVIKSATDIDKIISDNQYKYLELISRSKKYGGYNATPKDLKNKIAQVKKFLENLPEDIYFINFKISPRGDVFTYQFIKGNPPANLQESATPAATVIYSNPLEKFQTLDEWKRQEKRISELEKELELYKFKEDIKGSLNESNEQNTTKNAFLGFAETVLPSVMPVIDKFFTLQEKRLNIEEAKVKNAATIPAAPAVKKISIDSIPMPEAEGYNSFLNYFNTLNDSQADSLLNTLQVKRPEIYTDLISKFYTDESTETV